MLTGLSAFWFARTRDLVPNHLLRLGDDGRTMICRRLEMLPIECVVRGYLAGSGWQDYRETGAVCGHVLPGGLEESARLPEPIVTPATKATDGPRREHRRGAGGGALRRGALPRGEGRVARPLPVRLRARRGTRDHRRRHEVRVRGRAGRLGRPRRRGADARLVPLLALVGVRTRRPAAVVRQAVRPRLVRARPVGTRSRQVPSCRTTSSRERAPGTSRRSSG